MLLKPSWILFLLTIKIFKDNKNCWRMWLSHTKLFYWSGSLVQCLSYSRDQKFVTSLVQSAITCTQEWNVVQYLVNKTNMDSFQNESLSSIMKIALHTSTQYTVTHPFWSISPNSNCTSLWNKMNCITKPQQRISSVGKSPWLQRGRSQVRFLGPDQHSGS